MTPPDARDAPLRRKRLRNTPPANIVLSILLSRVTVGPLVDVVSSFDCLDTFFPPVEGFPDPVSTSRPHCDRVSSLWPVDLLGAFQDVLLLSPLIQPPSLNSECICGRQSVLPLARSALL